MWTHCSCAWACCSFASAVHQHQVCIYTIFIFDTQDLVVFRQCHVTIDNIVLPHICFALITDNFNPVSHGVTPEYGHVMKEGYSSIRDGLPVPESQAKKVVVVGWCGDIQDLVDSLNMFAPCKTTVTVLCDCCPDVSSCLHT